MSAADCLAILLCVLIVAAIALAGRPRRPRPRGVQMIAFSVVALCMALALAESK